DELSGVPLERFVREHERAHRATRVSPRRPCVDEDWNVLPLRLREGLGVIVIDERQNLLREGRHRRQQKDEEKLLHDPGWYCKLFSTCARYCFALAIAAGTSTVSTLPSRIRIFPSQIVVITELPDAA